LGVIIGFLIMGRIDSQTTQRLIGVILVSLVGLQFWRSRSRAVKDLSEETKPHPLLSGVTGVSAGITTMIANAAGPIMIIYLLAMRLPKMIFMGTSAWFFFAVNLFKVPFSYSLGLINLSSLRISLLLIPFAVAGALTGRVLIRYIDQRLFEILAMVLTLLAGLRLLLF
jgi:uncharacterized membrane protein YfcA